MIVIVLIQSKTICTKVININNINYCHHKSTTLYQSQVSILGPVGYGPTTLPLRHSD